MRIPKRTIAEKSESTKYAAMNYNELMIALNKQQEEIRIIQAQIESKRQEAIKEAMKAFVETMNSYGVSKADAKSALDMAELNWGCQGESPANGCEPVSTEEQNNDPIITMDEENNDVEVEASASGSVFDNPALKAAFYPLGEKKEEEAPESESTTVSDKEDEEDVPMDELLNDLYEYEAKRRGEKKGKREIPMNELLSGKPINQIMLMGNELKEGAPYRQHGRISHVDGIIPTETATGNTKIYIPA